MTTSRTLLALALAAALTACATTETTLPAVDLPPTNAAAVPGIDRWWTQFNDPQLTALIEEALAANLDLRIAVARIDEARASLRHRALVPVADGRRRFRRGALAAQRCHRAALPRPADQRTATAPA